jgi:hypothetical protein
MSAERVAPSSLPEKWRNEFEAGDMMTPFDHGVRAGLLLCADELEAALADPSAPSGPWCPCGFEPMNGYQWDRHRYHCPRSPTYHVKREALKADPPVGDRRAPQTRAVI